MIKTLEEIREKIKQKEPYLINRFHIKTIGIFGSFLGEEFTDESDIDILIEFSDPIDLFDFIRLEMFLTELLGRKVDLVMKSSLKPRIKNKILEEAIYL
jgi:hypothetical protein